MKIFIDPITGAVLKHCPQCGQGDINALLEKIQSEIEKLRKKPVKKFGDDDYVDEWNQSLYEVKELLNSLKT